MSNPTSSISPTDTAGGDSAGAIKVGTPSFPVKRSSRSETSQDGDPSTITSDSGDTIISSKRIKLEPVDANRRKQLLDFFETCFRRRRDQYLDHVLELFFLEQQGNLMEFYTWRRRAPTIPLLHYLRTIAGSNSDEFEQLQLDKARLDSIGPSGLKVVSLSQLSATIPPASMATSTAPQSALGTAFGSLSAPIGSTTSPSSTCASSSTLVSSAAPSTLAGASAVSTVCSSSSSSITSPLPTTSTTTTTAGSQRTPLIATVGATERNLVSVSSGGAVGVSKSGATATIPSSGISLVPTTLVTTLVNSGSSQSPTQITSTPIAHSKQNVTLSSQLRPSSGSLSVGPRAASSHTHHHHHHLHQHHHHSQSNSQISSANTLFSKLTAPIASKLGAHQNASAGSSASNLRASISSVYESSIGSQEQIAERAKQEAHVMQRVAELRREGLWSSKRLPKVQEPNREKAHWDYLLEEMTWISADFAEERKWKKSAAKKCSRFIRRFHQDKQQQVEKAEREEQQRLRKIASTMAKEIRLFWNNVEKLVEFKMQTKLEEKRKRALDIHLNFIVNQTEKFSSWLTEGMNKSETNTTTNSPMLCGNETLSSADDDDDEFRPQHASDDDEETIAREEAEIGLVSEHNELDLLRKESEMPIDELLATLPGTNFEPSPVVHDVLPSCSNSDPSLIKDDDVEFTANLEEELEDEEDTIAEQEQIEADADHEAELRALEAEADLPVEKLLQMYSGAFDEEMDDATESLSTTIADNVSEDQTEAEEDEDDEDESADSDEKDASPEIGVEFLINPDGQSTVEKEKNAGPTIEITDIAAGAELIQPKGNTLSAVQVSTKVPLLLKGSLREYQHIGLDWLVAMNEKKLNGILADEMGLGKTIQTIALLAHLACEKGIWGPHLIVVPTSVMLNWEMEFKKWCPGFKIITYYGNPKERKLKRQGWTKPNQFHVCITSYKLVIQDHASFRRKRWSYLILDEAQHIKNFKSQRWQMLLNFNTWRRLLLTGTPLQNNLMELWSLMHFLMPNVFSSHRDFKDWFVNPVTGMIEGNHEFNEGLIRRLHKVLRPFLLRRIKMDVEQQMPKKYEHVINCRLSKRQRFLYEEFMGLTKTKETLQSGNFLSVINVLMQLRKVCNHPNLFEERPVTSPLLLQPLVYRTASLATKPLDPNPLTTFDLDLYNLRFVDYSFNSSAFAAHRIKKFQSPVALFDEANWGCFDRDQPPPIPKNLVHLKVTTNQRTNNQPIQLISSPIAHVKASRAASISLTPTTNRHSPRVALKDLDSKQIVLANGDIIDSIKSKFEHNLDDDKSHLIHLKNSIKPIVHAQTNLDDELQEEEESVHEDSEVGRLRADQLKERLQRLVRLNALRCSRFALYGSDLIDVTNLQTHPHRLTSTSTWLEPAFNQGRGHFDCLFHLNRDTSARSDWSRNFFLRNLLKTNQQRSEEMNPVLERFMFLTPRVAAPSIQLHVSHPCPSKKLQHEVFEHRLRTDLSPCTTTLHRVLTNMSTQFPELRLIQYDCGKLQRLDRLLWQLKAGGHRALIFTQMSRMLDIFEQFLNYHGHTYLRLDGTTRIEQRQALMERFNADKRIFCFILSTRSGGVGVNLTGADTVIFYDSDWNPTMDAQAQDRCHRIGQTRDVHIYRLISEKTIEENILKKARQKKFLGDVAIEGGNFTTAFFRNDSIRELFAVNEKREEASVEEEVRLLSSNKDSSSDDSSDSQDKGRKIDLQLGQALQTAEEDTDVAAAKVAAAEADAEFAEFDENIPIDNADRQDEKSPEEEELDRLVYKLTPIEKYAMVFLETIQEPFQAEQLKQAEDEIEAQKKEWELEHLKSLKAEEERATSHSEPDELLTIWNEDASQMYLFSDEFLPMPVWAPPTPPQDDNDLYIDYSISLMYESQIIPESQLPPVYIPKEPKRPRIEASPVTVPPATVTPTAVAISPVSAPSRPPRPPKVRKEEHLNVPRSLFDRPSPSLVKLRRELKTLKSRGQLNGGPDIVQLQKIVASLGPNCNLSQPPTLQQQAALSKTPFFIMHGTQQENQIPWCINEDWILLDVIQHLQELPVNLLVLTPAHIPNWDLVADVLNARTSAYRSPKLCRHHYESVILQREEGKLADLPKKSNKKVSKQQPPSTGNAQQPNSQSNTGNNTILTTASNSKEKSPITPASVLPAVSVSSAVNHNNAPSTVTATAQVKPIRTSFLYHQDNNQSFTQLCSSRFDNIKQLAAKRTPTLKPIFINQPGPNPKHLTLLQENSIHIEQPLTPMMVATNRAERIAREKAKNQQLLEQQQQLARQKQAQLAQLQKQHQQQQQQQQSIGNTPIKGAIHGTTSGGQSIAPAAASGVNSAPNIRGNAIGAQFNKVTALPTAQLTLPKNATVQQFIATTTTGSPAVQNVSGPTTLSLSANQQVSNLAKALSQAAATFTAQKNSAANNSQSPSVASTIQLQSSAATNISRPGATTIAVNTSATGLPKLVTQSPVSISANIVSSQSSVSASPANTAVLSVSGIQTPQKIIAATLTNTPIAAGKLTPAQLQAYKQQLILRQQQQQQQQVTLQKHGSGVQTSNQSIAAPNVATASNQTSIPTQTIQIQAQGGTTQLTPIQIQQLPNPSNASGTVVGTPTGAMIVSTASAQSNIAVGNGGATRLQIASNQLIHQPQPNQGTNATLIKGNASIATTAQMVSISTAGGPQLMNAAGQLIQRSPSASSSGSSSGAGISNAALITTQGGGSSTNAATRVPVTISSGKVNVAAGVSANTLPLAVPISGNATQRIFTTTGIGNKPQQIIARTATEAELAQLLGGRATTQRIQGGSASSSPASSSLSTAGGVGPGTTTVAVAAGHPIVTASGKSIQLPAGLTQVQLLHIQPPATTGPASGSSHIQTSSIQQSSAISSASSVAVASSSSSNATAQLVAVSTSGSLHHQTVSSVGLSSSNNGNIPNASTASNLMQNASFNQSSPVTTVAIVSQSPSAMLTSSSGLLQQQPTVSSNICISSSSSSVATTASVSPSTSGTVSQPSPQLQLQAAPVATLVKTVAAPGSIGAAGANQTMTIPVSAVTMTGVNLLTSQMSKDASGAPSGTTYFIYAQKGNTK